MASRKTFFQVLTEAIDYFAAKGYTSQADLNRWIRLLKEALDRQLGSPKHSEAEVRRVLKAVYNRQIIRGGALKQNPTVTKFSVDMLKPTMRRELERRMLASANLIKLNRQEAISSTLRRFEGWATSIPKGGSKAVEIRKEKTKIRKAVIALTYQERRVIIDQSQKFAAALNATIATDNRASAAEWHSRWRTAGYDYREDHKERDGKIYAVADNWAIREGLMKAGKHGYTQDITQPAEEVFCQCRYTYIYSIASLPDDMLTEKGRRLLNSAK